MQDFTKPFTLENNPRQLEFNIPKQSKTGFIAARINKDNFWNLMFWLGMFGGISIAFITKFMILSWVTIIGIIWLVKKNSNITFEGLDNGTPTFLVNGNKKLKATGIGFVALMVTSFFVTALFRAETVISMLFGLWSIPPLYCILKNIPIAVYFKKEAWIDDGTSSYSYSHYFPSTSRHASSPFIGRSSSISSSRATSYHSGSYSSSSSRSAASYSRESIITSPIHRSFSSNIHHRK
jgi:hypothetical protein